MSRRDAVRQPVLGIGAVHAWEPTEARMSSQLSLVFAALLAHHVQPARRDPDRGWTCRVDGGASMPLGKVC
jgi:hypothetical protein